MSNNRRPSKFITSSRAFDEIHNQLDNLILKSFENAANRIEKSKIKNALFYLCSLKNT